MTRRTYWHLEPLRRRPSDYEVTTSRLSWHPTRGFEVDVPLVEWFARFGANAHLRCGDWERFSDPRETTYTKYTDLQRVKETFVDGLLAVIDKTAYDATLSPTWLWTLDRVLAPMRYPVHGLQMAAAYVGHLAPSGRIVVTAALQAADEVRRVHRLAYRMRQLQETHASFGQESKTTWTGAAVWQPWREVVERLLVTYDWGEAFTALCLVAKPAFDELLLRQLGLLAESQGDDMLTKLFLSLHEDCVWHESWSQALVALLVREDAENGATIAGWIRRWREPVARAVEAFAPVFDDWPDREPRPSFADVRKEVSAAWTRVWGPCGLTAAGNGAG